MFAMARHGITGRETVTAQQQSSRDHWRRTPSCESRIERERRLAAEQPKSLQSESAFRSDGIECALDSCVGAYPLGKPRKSDASDLRSLMSRYRCPLFRDMR